MVRKLKAVADIMLLIGMAIGMILIFFDFTPAWYEGDVYKVMLHTHMYGMSNALDGAELYINTSLDYSVYQAFYDVLKQGGFEAIEEGKGESGMAYWGDPDSIPNREQVTEALRNRIEQNLAKYNKAGYSFTIDYDVSLPEYKVSLQEQSGTIRITTSSGDANMTIMKQTQEYGLKEDVLMKRPFLPEGVYDIDYARMLEIGQALEDEEISSELDKIIKEQPQSKLNTKEVKEALEEAIESKLENDFKKTIDDYTQELTLHTVSVTGFYESEESYAFDVNVIVKTEITYDKEVFPVYDSSTGKVLIDNIGLVFLKKFSYSVSSS